MITILSTNTMRVKQCSVLFAIVFTLLLIFHINPSYAHDRNGLPEYDAVCDDYSGGLKGICVAYCSALNCDADRSHKLHNKHKIRSKHYKKAKEVACKRLERLFEKRSGGMTLPCLANEVPECTLAGVDTDTKNVSLSVNDNLLITANASDPDGDTLTYSIANKPGFTVFNSLNGQLSGQPVVGDIGNYQNISISVTDGANTAVCEPKPFSVTVVGGNQAPVCQLSNNGDVTLSVNEQLSISVLASDPDGDTLTYSINNAPAFTAFNPATGALTGIPTAAGEFPNISITVSDGVNTATCSPQNFSVIVQAANESPSCTLEGNFMNGNYNAIVGVPLSISANAFDPDGDMLNYIITNQPNFVILNSTTGAIIGTPTNGDINTYPNVTVSVSDGVNPPVVCSPSFDLVVTAPANNSPSCVLTSIPNNTVTVAAGQALNITPVASDPDGDTLSFMIDNMPIFALFDALTGQLTGMPTNSDIGTFPGISISVSDGQDTSVCQTLSGSTNFSLTVTQVANNSPVILGTPPSTVSVNQVYSFTPIAADPDGDTLSFSAQNLPSFLTINTATGKISGTPVTVGVYNNIVISVTDGTNIVSLPAFSITVVP